MEMDDKKARAAQTRKLNKIRKDEHEKIVGLLKAIGTYSTSLTPLIETYLDAYVVYTVMYEEWRNDGFQATIMYVNKAGHINEMKHPLAQQVADWNSKISKLLELLGLTPKLQKMVNGSTPKSTDKIQAFTQKWAKK